MISTNYTSQEKRSRGCALQTLSRIPECVLAHVIMPQIKTALFIFFSLIFHFGLSAEPYQKVKVGIDQLMEHNGISMLQGKRIGLITNHTAINSQHVATVDVLKANAKRKGYTLIALFAPEHGITGAAYADANIAESKDADNIPIYSLHGKTKRPTAEMLKNINMLIFDIQDIGTRSYTYISTLFYAMEEAAKHNIAFVVLDRPNPINGRTIDGPMLEEKWRSMLGYINVPYCHGMTIGELASFFNSEYKIGCKLEVIPMKGWKRNMTFQDTGLTWIPTSPYIPEPSTPFFYPTTGILGELKLVNIGIGYTLPFKLVGAPWINAIQFAAQLNALKFPGVHFDPFYYKPMYGRFAKEQCQGVLIVITNPKTYKPVSTQYLILGVLKSMYPKNFQESVEAIRKHKETLCKLNGTEEIYRLLIDEKYIIWKLCAVHEKERATFAELRKKYLIESYGS